MTKQEVKLLIELLDKLQMEILADKVDATYRKDESKIKLFSKLWLSINKLNEYLKVKEYLKNKAINDQR